MVCCPAAVVVAVPAAAGALVREVPCEFGVPPMPGSPFIPPGLGDVRIWLINPAAPVGGCSCEGKAGVFWPFRAFC